MGLPFRRKTNPKPATPVAAPASGTGAFVSHAEALQALISHLLDRGTFLGSQDQNADFATQDAPDGLQIAQNDADMALCILADRVAGFSIVGIDPGRMVFLIVDPVINQIFERQPDWHTQDDMPDVWTTRLALSEGLSLLMDCKAGPAELAGPDVARPGATLTLQVLTEH